MLRMDDLGSALRVARLQHGWSQADVAQRIGVAQSHVAKIEAGSDARFSTIRRMAAAFGLDIVLMQSDGSPQSDSDRAFESARAFGVDIASLKLSLQMSPSERFHAAVRAATNLATLRR